MTDKKPYLYALQPTDDDINRSSKSFFVIHYDAYKAKDAVIKEIMKMKNTDLYNFINDMLDTKYTSKVSDIGGVFSAEVAEDE